MSDGYDQSDDEFCADLRAVIAKNGEVIVPRAVYAEVIAMMPDEVDRIRHAGMPSRLKP